MKYLIDTHTHTIASGHAYNTIDEMTRYAAGIGTKYLGITEHAPKMPGSCGLFYFGNLKVVPRKKYGVNRLMGCEANIIDFKGRIDLDKYGLKQCDIVIASLHIPCIKPGAVEENTTALIGAMKNPYVNIIGHPDDNRYPVDYEAVVKAAKENHVLLELNNTSLKEGGPRKDARQNDVKMLKLCKEMNVCISLGSDAHIEEDICNFALAEELLCEVDFPERLIANTDIDLLRSYL
ncbi:MAG: phosphatase [Eubacteriales bacterium]|nr:phosphatase [Eubacteriales bacterium]